LSLCLSPPLHFGNQDARIEKELHLELERERKGENSSNVADDDMPELEMAGGEPSLWELDEDELGLHRMEEQAEGAQDEEQQVDSEAQTPKGPITLSRTPSMENRP
jgi:hypothetical protein